MVETAAVVTWTTKILESFWIIWWLFVIMVIAIIFVLIRYVPVAFKAHFDAIKVMQQEHNKTTLQIQDKFTQQLDGISTKYLSSLAWLWDEHAKQMEKLNDIHNEIKILNRK